MAFTRYKNLQEGKQFFHILFFRGPAGYKAHDEGVLILAFPDLKIDVFPEGLDHFFRKDDKLLVRIGVDVEGVAFFQQALFQFHVMKELYVDPAHTGRDRAIGTAAANGSLKATGVPGMTKSSAETEVKLDWKAQKEEQARIRKRQNDLKKVEDEIHRLETRDGEIDTLLSQEEIYTDVARLVELNNEKESLQQKLEELYETWEELAE